MSDKGPATTRRRMLVGAASFADARSALDLAKVIARDHALDLYGLLMNEAAAAAQSDTFPAALITMTGHVLATPGSDELHRLFRAEERAFRRALSHMAEERGTAWSFESRAGELTVEASSASQNWDFQVIGHYAARRNPGRIVLLRTSRPGHQEGETIATTIRAAIGGSLEIVDLPSGWSRREETAAEPAPMARLGGGDIGLVIIDLSGAAPPNAVRLRRLLEKARYPLVIIGPRDGTESRSS